MRRGTGLRVAGGSVRRGMGLSLAGGSRRPHMVASHGVVSEINIDLFLHLFSFINNYIYSMIYNGSEEL